MTSSLPAGFRQHIFFTGFMATGKSRIGQIVADRLRLPFVDTDHWIEARHRKTVPELFAERGEAAFRELEMEALEHLVAEQPRVISLGGGTLLHRRALPLIRETGVLVGLWARPEVISDRVGRRDSRPLLANLESEDRLRRIREMLAERQHLYAQADFQVESTEQMEREELAEEVLRQLAPWLQKALSVPLGDRTYPIFTGPGLLRHLPLLCRQRGLLGRPVLVTDSAVARHLAPTIENLRAQWPGLLVYSFPSGEEHKTLESVSSLFSFLLENKCDRKAFLIALSGGVAGDMTGFAAACYQRGIDFVQAPTTLLSMVDSSVGGKTGVNHPLGKNMIGAFHQPRLVVADTDTLATLPGTEYVAGLSEVVKYGVIMDEPFFAWLEDNADALRAGEPAAVAEIVRRSCRCKAEVVGQDEREDGLRAILNYGHTYGHALEFLSDYSGLVHGDAVALGMRCAARLSTIAGLWEPACEERQNRLLDRLGLPAHLPEGLRSSIDADAALEAMRRDKKSADGRIRLVVPRAIGRVEIRGDIDPELVRGAWKAVLEAAA